MEDKLIKLLQDQNKKLDVLIKNTTISVEREGEIWKELQKTIQAGVRHIDPNL